MNQGSEEAQHEIRVRLLTKNVMERAFEHYKLPETYSPLGSEFRERVRVCRWVSHSFLVVVNWNDLSLLPGITEGEIDTILDAYLYPNQVCTLSVADVEGSLLGFLNEDERSRDAFAPALESCKADDLPPGVLTRIIAQAVFNKPEVFWFDDI